MRTSTILILAMLWTISSTAQTHVTLEETGADEIVRIWDNSSAPHSNLVTSDEKVDGNGKLHNSSSLDLYIYHADKAHSTGQGMVMFPGGGYLTVNFSKEVARFFRDMGLTVAVVKYRIPNSGHCETTLEDAVRSVRYMRENAARLGIDPERIGVLGASAGGHLASWVSNRMPGEEPAFTILLYPNCIRSGFYVSNRGPVYMLGNGLNQELLESIDTPRMVNGNTPPTLILHSDDDPAVHPFSSTEYYKALKRYGVRASLHIYPSGGHAWWGRESFRYASQWHAAATDFLKVCNQTKPKK